MLRIDKIMKERNITTLQLAEMMNVTPQYISEVVNERKNITIVLIAVMLLALRKQTNVEMRRLTINLPG